MAGSWARLTESSAAVRFIDTNLRGSGQVMLQDNPLTGLLFLIGIGWSAVVSGSPQLAIGAPVGLVVATCTAIGLGVDRTALRSGLFGYNGMLVGMALSIYLAANPLFWAYLVVGAGISVVVMLAMVNIAKTWGVPVLTAPFVLTTWLMLLGSYNFAAISLADLPPPALPSIHVASAMPLDSLALVDAALFGVSQVFFIGNAITGVIFLLALLVSSRWAAAYALAGTVLAIAVAQTLGANSDAIAAGLFGFSPVLTAIAIGTMFDTPRPRVVFYVAAATIFTVITQAALNSALMPLGIPVLTAPFVAVTWLFLLPLRKLVL
ncbi:urea transporter [Aerobium aerolatum]|uniref:Urea transporter n=1 Tax=Aquamicrobium aerolatum DSM 21857 TaxID=1121003 RepID=A0A1I3R4W8_9HYPH|nr:urea transporter [Aquamicrobium aerolatum]SFJ41644.1 urea transporter [Aquamicrobium aerolatum DSM 21857]